MLTLASTSQTRKQLLSAAGVPFETLSVRIDEEGLRAALEAEGASPRDMADALAEAKARRASAKGAKGLVLGADQILACDGRVFGKAKDRDQAFDTLSALAGKTHVLHSGAVIYEDNAPVWRFVGTVKMTMHALTSDQIDQYLASAWPDVSGSVGAYHAEGLGMQLFSRIDGDWFSVLGLPMLQILSYLRLRGGLSGE